MKKFVKRIVLCTASALALASCIPFSACFSIELGGDEVFYYRMSRKDSDNGFYVYSLDNWNGICYRDFERVEVDPVNLSYKTYSADAFPSENVDAYELVASGTTSENWSISITDGYEELEKHLGGDANVIDCIAWNNGDTITGICNYYKGNGGRTTLVLGNQNRIDKIDYSIIFDYNVLSDAFTVMYKAEGVVSYAYSDGTLICIKNSNYCAINIATGEEKVLTEYTFGEDYSDYLYFDNDYVYFELNTSYYYETYRYLYNLADGSFNLLTESQTVIEPEGGKLT